MSKDEESISSISESKGMKKNRTIKNMKKIMLMKYLKAYATFID